MTKKLCEKQNELSTMTSNILILENDKQQLFEKIERGAIIESKKYGKTYSHNIREAGKLPSPEVWSKVWSITKKMFQMQSSWNQWTTSLILDTKQICQRNEIPFPSTSERDHPR